MAEATFYSLVDDLEKLLEFERDNGVKRMDVDRAVLVELARVPEVQSVAPVVPVAETVPEEVPALALESASLADIATIVTTCSRCDLCKGRTNAVPGEGNMSNPDVMFIGEGPGADEDAQGRPFVGKAGMLLTKMIEAMGYKREEVFIANIVKCRPPNNRAPQPDEMKACLPYLQRQVELVKPKMIVALGATAVKGLLGRAVGITRLRGNWQEYEDISLMPTYHPSYLLRDPSKKKEVWLDLQAVLAKLGKEPPPRKK